MTPKSNELTPFGHSLWKSYLRRFPSGHIHILAMYAAFPAALSSDLLYKIWINFVKSSSVNHYSKNPVLVSDFLLSPICREVGRDTYIIYNDIRKYLLRLLKESEGVDRNIEKILARFLKEYLQTSISKIPNQAFLEANLFQANIFLEPLKASQYLMDLLKHEITLGIKSEQLDKSIESLEASSKALNSSSNTTTFSKKIIQRVREYQRGNIDESYNELNQILSKKIESIDSREGIKVPLPKVLFDKLEKGSLDPPLEINEGTHIPQPINPIKGESSPIPNRPKSFSGTGIFAVGIGINNYLSGDIPDLSECENDVERLREVLKKKIQIPSENYLILKNSSASRENILHVLSNQFREIEDGSVIFLHYCGHGTWEYANQNLVKAGIEPEKGAVECLVPYDSEMNGTRNIADLELRWLIHQMQYDKDGNYKNIHVVVILDCSFSGSMIRMDEVRVKIRMHAGLREAREIDEFIGPYKDIGSHKAIGPNKLPSVNYILMNASSSDQLAVEIADEGGVFTTALVRALNSSVYENRLPSYAELNSITRTIIKSNNYSGQTPQFTFAGESSPYDCFLLFGDKQLSYLPSLFFKDGNWKIGLGAIHGVTFSYKAPTEISVYDPTDLEKPVGSVVATGVEVEFTPIRLVEGSLNPEKSYVAELTGKKMLLRVENNGVPNQLRSIVLEKIALPIYSQSFHLDDTADYTLSMDEEALCIYHFSKGIGSLVLGVKDYSDEGIEFILSWLLKIAKWDLIKSLETPVRSGFNRRDLKLTFEYDEYDYSTERFSIPNDSTDSWPSNFRKKITYDPNLGGKPFIISLENTFESEIYSYLFFLNRYFGISQLYESYNSPISYSAKVELYDSMAKSTVLGISDPNLDSVENTFLLVVSKFPLSMSYLIEQDGLGENLGKILSKDEWKSSVRERFQRRAVGGDNSELFTTTRADWTVLKMEVEVVREKFKG